MKNVEKTMNQIVVLCKGRGLAYPGSEIYGGLANSRGHGSLGVELKNDVKRAWWKKSVQENPHNMGLDAAILMNPEVWVAPGHVSTSNDLLIDCKTYKMRHRVDKPIEGRCAENGCDDVNVEAITNEELVAFIRDNGVTYPGYGKADFTDIRKFGLMFKTHQGATEDSSTEVYLRPKIAQGIFVNFPVIQRTTRKELPLGVCQVGGSFRNEIAPDNFIFRIREFGQTELEFFCQPGTDLEWSRYWREFYRKWLVDLGLKEENLRLRDREPEELAFYSKATTDFELTFPLGWGELRDVADRADCGLRRHQERSGKDLTYFNQEENEHYIPYVIKSSLGADRVTLAFLVDVYGKETVDQDKKGSGDVCTVLCFHLTLIPLKCTMLPLNKKKVLSGPAQQLQDELARDFMMDYDDTGSIGKHYRRQDETGTPFRITLGFQTVGDDVTPAGHCVTIQERDSIEQVRIPMSRVENYIAERIKL